MTHAEFSFQLTSNKMPIDPSIIPHLSEALGAGYESIIHSVNGTPVQGGTRAAKSPKRKARRVRGGQRATESPSISGGRSPRRKRFTFRRQAKPKRSRSRLSPSALRRSMVRSLARLLVLRSAARRR